MEERTYPDADTQDMDLDLELEELLEREAPPPEAFYQALRKALVQLEQHAGATWG